jgi:hypothetical protein
MSWCPFVGEPDEEKLDLTLTHEHVGPDQSALAGEQMQSQRGFAGIKDRLLDEEMFARRSNSRVVFGKAQEPHMLHRNVR